LIGTLSAGFHPITLLAGAVFLAVALLWIFKNGKIIQNYFSLPVFFATALALIGSLMSLAGWLFVMVQTKSQLAISDWISRIDGYSFDKWWVRLTPFPFDSRMLHWKELSFEGTPHLDTQVAMPLILILVILYRSYWSELASEVKTSLKKWALVVIVLFWWSCNAENTTFIRELLGPIQFTYRLVTYVNLGLLQFVLLALWLKKSPGGTQIQLGRNHENRTATALVLFITFQLVFKMSNASRIIETNGESFVGPAQAQADKFLDLPPTFYGPYSYSMQKLYLPIAPESELKKINFLPMTKPLYGETSSLNIEVDSEQWFQTNVLPHRWNTILIDGNVSSSAEKRFLTTSKTTALRLAPGSHTLSYIFSPPPELGTWRSLQTPGLLLLILGAVILGLSALFDRPTRRNTK
jgi:hypothetical protein